VFRWFFAVFVLLWSHDPLVSAVGLSVPLVYFLTLNLSVPSWC